MDDKNTAKAQLIEKLRSATNILVSVSANPSVDQLAACIALTLLLNNYKKNTTAVFSGRVPSMLNFLKPSETFETSTDSLRDFIIALDKSKADKLRYKVEDDVVKIFITPYKTNITADDLHYSAGDFNVDLILALGVQHQQDLDTAITSHGRIFHDAVVMSLNNVAGGDFGVANWEDLDASSLSELVANLIEALDPSLLDAPVATALLTGIVAETSRFSNAKTHPRTMTVSSTLLAAGADQQLVNIQLQDLIGSVVTLQAGTEIKPTMLAADGLHHDDVSEELIIDESGALLSQPAAAPIVMPQPVDLQPEIFNSVTTTQTSTPPSDMQPPAGPAAATPAEAAFGTSSESVPAPLLDNAGYAQLVIPATDADSARQAVEAALAVAMPDNEVDAVGEVATIPAGELQNAQVAEPAPIFYQPEALAEVSQTPLLTTIPNDQPSYASPMTTTAYNQVQPPAPSVNEPAPLSMSPADQPFTMPMPPMSSMPAYNAAPQQAPGLALPSATAEAVAPPLPPPMMPPTFGNPR